MSESNQNSNYTEQVKNNSKYGFTMCPHIVIDLCHLSGEAFMLYHYYLRICGDSSGACWKKAENVKKDMGYSSTSTYTKYRKELSKPRKELNGRSLINIDDRIKDDGEYDTTLITINDIWDLNNLYLVDKESFKNKLGVVQEFGQPPSKNLDDVVQEFGLKEEYTKKNTNIMIDRFDAVDGESDLSMKKEEEDFTELTPDSNRTLVFKSNSSMTKVVTHPVADLFRKYLAIGFSEETIKEAICKMLQKNPKLNGTVDAYFQTVLKNTQNNEKKLKRNIQNGNKCTKPSNKPSSLQRQDRKIVSRIRSGCKDE